VFAEIELAILREWPSKGEVLTQQAIA